MTTKPRMITTSEAARLLDVSPRTVRRMAAQLGGERVGTRRLRFPEPRVLAARDARGIAG